MGNKRFRLNPNKAKRLWDIPGSEEASSLVLDGVALYTKQIMCVIWGTPGPMAPAKEWAAILTMGGVVVPGLGRLAHCLSCISHLLLDLL